MTTSLPRLQPRFVPTAPSPRQSLSPFRSWSHFPRRDWCRLSAHTPTDVYATHSNCQSLRRTSSPKLKSDRGALTQIRPRGFKTEGCPSAAVLNRFQGLSFLRAPISRWRLSVWSSEKHLEMSGFIIFLHCDLLNRVSDMLWGTLAAPEMGWYAQAHVKRKRELEIRFYIGTNCQTESWIFF